MQDARCKMQEEGLIHACNTVKARPTRCSKYSAVAIENHHHLPRTRSAVVIESECTKTCACNRFATFSAAGYYIITVDAFTYVSQSIRTNTVESQRRENGIVLGWTVVTVRIVFIGASKITLTALICNLNAQITYVYVLFPTCGFKRRQIDNNGSLVCLRCCW